MSKIFVLFFRLYVIKPLFIFTLIGFCPALSSAKITIGERNKVIKLYDPISDKMVEYLPISRFIDGKPMSLDFCDQVIYRTYKGTFYKRFFQGAINIKWYGIKGSNEDDPLKVYDAFLKAWKYALLSRHDLYIPAGTYNAGNNNFPFRVNEKSDLKGLLDCKNIAIYGDGDRTILKTESVNGADVLQLNKLKNLRVRNLSITATVKSSNVAGSNGISITNGFDNIIIDQVTVMNLRGVNRNGNLDGGKALTIQLGKGTDFYCGRIIAKRIKSLNCLYGFTFNGCVSDILKKSIDVDVDISIKNSYIGLLLTYSAPYENGNIDDNPPKIKIAAKTLNCQKDIMVSRGIGINLDLSIQSTKSKSDLMKSFDGSYWNKSDTIVWAGYFNYIKNGNIVIRGNKPGCDYKMAVGAVGSINDPYNLINRTENCTFDIDITGKSRGADFILIEFKGQSIYKSTLNFSKRTISNKPLPGILNKNYNKLRLY